MSVIDQAANLKPPLNGLAHMPQGFQMHNGAWNIHASACLIKNKALIVTGPAASGKTSLVWAVFKQAQKQAIPYNWIADDRLIIELKSEGFSLGAPEQLFGLAQLPLKAGQASVELARVAAIAAQALSAHDILWIEITQGDTALSHLLWEDTAIVRTCVKPRSGERQAAEIVSKL